MLIDECITLHLRAVRVLTVLIADCFLCHLAAQLAVAELEIATLSMVLAYNPRQAFE